MEMFAFGKLENLYELFQMWRVYFQFPCVASRISPSSSRLDYTLWVGVGAADEEYFVDLVGTFDSEEA
jgi:hypothetical protein